MGTMYWFRVLLMATMLAAVLLSMKYLNTNTKKIESVALCPSRITWLEAGGLRLEQKDSKWLRTTANIELELEPIAVEKWFSRFCTIVANGVTPKGEFQSFMKLGFVTGAVQEVLKSQTGEFLLGKHAFTSGDLNEAMRTLPALPAVRPPGHP